VIVSIHVPKAAGSHLAAVLRRRYGRRLALWYGPDDPRTHPLARRPAREFDEPMARALEGAGVAVLHGHFPARHALKAVPDPARHWIVLREPVERTVSHYHFLRRSPASVNPLARMVRDDGVSLAEFAALDRIRTFQRRYVERLPLDRSGFAGVAELLPLLLPALGLNDSSSRGNVNPDKPMVDGETRRALAGPLADELALYSEAMALSVRRLSTRDRRAGPVYSLGRLLPWRAAAAAPTRSEETA